MHTHDLCCAAKQAQCSAYWMSWLRATAHCHTLSFSAQAWLCALPLLTWDSCRFRQCTNSSVRRVLPASFAWFTPQLYAPALGFLMFSIGINLKPQAFRQVLARPQVACARA